MNERIVHRTVKQTGPILDGEAAIDPSPPIHMERENPLKAEQKVSWIPFNNHESISVSGLIFTPRLQGADDGGAFARTLLHLEA